MSARTMIQPDLEYPDSDGEPMAENTLQFDVLTTFKWGVESLYQDDRDVFVAGDLLIYPVQGSPKIRQAPDVFVVYGRPKTFRGSYKVWEEELIFPQVVIEVWSPGNSGTLETRKLAFYEKYGAEEYYIIYPGFPSLVKGFLRKGRRLLPVEGMSNFTSPRMQVRFAFTPEEVKFFEPDGREIERPDQVKKQRDQAEKKLDFMTQRADALAAKLRALGIDPDAVAPQ